MINKEAFLYDGEAFVQNNRVTLKIMEPKYKRDFFETLEPVKWTSDTKRIEEYHEIVWDELNNESNITYSIISTKTGNYIGYCQYKNMNRPEQDIGIELLPDFRGQGFGYNVCCELITKAFNRTDIPALYYRVERKNAHSVALVEKLGGKPHRTEHTVKQILDAIKIIGKDSPTLTTILEELEKERDDEEFPTDILTYKIEREVWEKRYG